MKKSIVPLCIILFSSFSIIAHAESGDTIVHRTQTGYAYHIADCYHLKSDIEITLREAYESGLSPCEDCTPPKLNEDEISDILASKKVKPQKSSYSNNGSSSSSKTNNKNKETLKIIKGNDNSDNWLWVSLSALASAIITALYMNSGRKKDKNSLIDTANLMEHLEKEHLEYKKQIENLTQNINQKQKRIDFLMGTERLGNILHDFTDMPENVKFTNDGFPYDASTNGKYGSFTTYISRNGNKYHMKKGCSGANQEAHIIDVVSQYYTPCRNCCKKPYEIPKWYLSYRTLLRLLK